MTRFARRSLLAMLLGLGLLGCQQRVAQEAEEPPHPLVGKNAPLFTAPLLAGGRYDLAESLGSKVVILDFWATWCGPCRAALPTLSEVAAEFRDRGVEFYAVDLNESQDEVESFLEQAGLELTVLMDEGNHIATLYQAEAIPQTVIIDRSGKIRFVHVGLSPDLRKRLTSELNELVAESGAPSAEKAATETAAASENAVESAPTAEPAAQ